MTSDPDHPLDRNEALRDRVDGEEEALERDGAEKHARVHQQLDRLAAAARSGESSSHAEEAHRVGV